MSITKRKTGVFWKDHWESLCIAVITVLVFASILVYKNLEAVPSDDAIVFAERITKHPEEWSNRTFSVFDGGSLANETLDITVGVYNANKITIYYSNDYRVERVFESKADMKLIHAAIKQTQAYQRLPLAQPDYHKEMMGRIKDAN